MDKARLDNDKNNPCQPLTKIVEVKIWDKQTKRWAHHCLFHKNELNNIIDLLNPESRLINDP
jgi:hypothetical protein